MDIDYYLMMDIDFYLTTHCNWFYRELELCVFGATVSSPLSSRPSLQLRDRTFPENEIREWPLYSSTWQFLVIASGRHVTFYSLIDFKCVIHPYTLGTS